MTPEMGVRRLCRPAERSKRRREKDSTQRQLHRPEEACSLVVENAVLSYSQKLTGNPDAKITLSKATLDSIQHN
jgi:hypothetical protein